MNIFYVCWFNLRLLVVWFMMFLWFLLLLSIGLNLLYVMFELRIFMKRLVFMLLLLCEFLVDLIILIVVCFRLLLICFLFGYWLCSVVSVFVVVFLSVFCWLCGLGLLLDGFVVMMWINLYC